MLLNDNNLIIQMFKIMMQSYRLYSSIEALIFTYCIFILAKKNLFS